MSDILYRIFFTPAAEKDMRTAWRHVAQHDVNAADRLFDALDGRAKALKQFPERGVPRDDLSQGMRMLVEGKYLIFYRVEESAVRVLRVLYGPRELEGVLFS
jgi:toxin ParE1/3/4